MMLSKDAVITSNTNLFGDYYLLEVSAKGIGLNARPGQFFMLKVGAGTDPLLRRPFGLHKIVSPDSIKMLYRAAGYGTKLLTKMVKGDALNILGPLGNGFKVEKDTNHALIVAGGIGVAPMVALAEEIKRTRPDIHAACFIGGRGKDDILGVNEFRKLGLRVYVSTEDGSLPKKGYVTDPLEQYMSRFEAKGFGGWAIYSCGPTPMLRSVAAVAARHGIKNFASLEANMACGIGACMGCVVSVQDKEHGSQVYKKVCEDGPVFDAEDVVW